jgi:hypothetical protein
MPAVASLEDLKAAQKKGLGIYAMLYALPVFRSPARRDVGGCSMLHEDGAVLDGKIFVNLGWRKGHRNS